jgi:hypothetical protein
MSKASSTPLTPPTTITCRRCRRRRSGRRRLDAPFFWRPLAASGATARRRRGHDRLLPASAGVNTAVPALPTEYFHTVRTAIDASSGRPAALAGSLGILDERVQRQGAARHQGKHADTNELFRVIRIFFNLDLGRFQQTPRMRVRRGNDELRCAFFGRHRAADRFKLQLDQLAARVLLVGRPARPGRRCGLRPACSARPARRPCGRHHGAGTAAGIAAQRLERVVVGFFVEQHAGQAQAWRPP